MATARVWNVCYYLGNTGRTSSDNENPQRRRAAINAAEAMAITGWHVWVEHVTTGKRIYDNRDTSRPEGWTVVPPEQRQKASE